MAAAFTKVKHIGDSNGSTGYKWLELAFSASISNTE